MAYDIYGVPLRSGYCEVHPGVPETYPCSYCVQESEEHYRQMDRQPEYTIEDYCGSEGHVLCLENPQDGLWYCQCGARSGDINTKKPEAADEAE